VFRRKVRPAQPVEAAAQEASPAVASTEGAASDSKLISIISATFGTQNTKTVLDFAGANQHNLAFFSQFSCQYNVLNFYQEWLYFRAKGKNFQDFLEIIKARLPVFNIQKYDVIFLWDNLNYLGAEESKQVLEMLKNYCHYKTYIYCMVSINNTIPNKPMRAYVLDHNQVGYGHNCREEDMIPNPEHYRHGNFNASKFFKHQHSSLLKNGVKEVLLALERDEAV
jgi:hypothetical protein